MDGTLAVLLSTCVFLTYKYLKWKFTFWERHGVPHLKPRNWLLGNLEGVGRRNVADYFGAVYKHMRRDELGPIAGFYFFTEPALIVTNPDILKHILVRDFEYFCDRGIYVNEVDDPLSAHLFSLEGNNWKQLRAKLTPTFTSKKMKMMFEIVHKIGHNFEMVLHDLAVENTEMELKDLFSCFTIDVIGSCAFGIECDSLRNPKSEIKEVGMQIFGNTHLEMFKLAFISAFQDFARRLGCRFTTVKTEKFIFDLIQRTMKFREEHNIKRNDFFDLLLQLKNNGRLDDQEETTSTDNYLTLNEIAAQCFVFFLAGFETSSTVMACCAYELAENQQLQSRLRDHINEVLAKYDGKVTYESLKNMPYLDQVIYEGLRIYPSLTMLQRKVVKDYKVPGTEYSVQAGQMVIIPTYSIQRDERFFKDPLTFDPDRFAEDRRDEIPPFAFLPFGDGPRVCIGQRFGMMQTRMGLVTLLRRFKVEVSPRTVEKIELSPLSTLLQAKDGIWARIVFKS